MYPKLAAVTTECKMCDGEGHEYHLIQDVETKIKCTDCNGTGKVIPFSREGIIGLPQYIDEGKTPYPGSPASYITPDNASLETAMTDLRELGKDILYSATGDKNLITETLNTATENLINFKGLEDRIAEIVEMVESREEFIIKTTAKMHLDFTDAIKSCSVRYGRRLVIRGESEIIVEIKTSKESGMPISHIEMLQRELIYTRYKNNKVELERQQLLADVEPLNGYTVQEAISMAPYVDDLKIKFNFNRLTDMFEAQHGKIEMYKPEMEWKKRVIDIYNQYKELSNEILPVEGDGGQD
jgi:predicted RNA-binding protein with EMAP domain